MLAPLISSDVLTSPVLLWPLASQSIDTHLSQFLYFVAKHSLLQNSAWMNCDDFETCLSAIARAAPTATAEMLNINAAIERET